jgi:hypothetical protein
MINVYGYVHIKGQRKAGFDNSVYLGTDADEKKPALFLGKDPTKGYAGFADLISRLDTLKNAYERAIPLLAKDLAADIHKAMSK